MLKGFKDFVFKGNIVDLAVAVLIATAFGKVVAALTTDLITPIFALIGGKPSFNDFSFTIGKAEFLYGKFLTELVGFLITAAVIYFAVVLPVNKVLERAAKEEAAVEAKPSNEEVLLAEIRDLLAKG